MKNTISNKKGHKLILTKYNTYVDPNDDGMVQQKNAISFKDAKSLGYE